MKTFSEQLKAERKVAYGYTKKWRDKNPEKVKLIRLRWHLKRYYGMTVEEYDAMLTSQGNCCATCLGTQPGGNGRWHVDHCHDTNRIRGLLCWPCNAVLGNAKNNPETLRRMASYLERAKS
jgi:hypothetical protein